jgi:acetyl-CoA carboxylase biotin carboxyl carrier protein
VTETAPTDVSVLEAACRNAMWLLSATPTPPRRVSVEVGDVSVEMEWPTAGEAVTAAPEPAAAPAAELPRGSTDDETHYIRAETVGTFYRAPEPGADAFVVEGDIVVPGQQIAILETMKLMIPVPADRPGRVTGFLVKDMEPVEFGTPLVALEPTDAA